ncbi:unnamed protein product [Amoebophrya sp. A120]|nr:unnamed protein product [Amoebophrya sp. A120]|eukprot:GSA120T00020601001.1
MTLKPGNKMLNQQTPAASGSCKGPPNAAGVQPVSVQFSMREWVRTFSVAQVKLLFVIACACVGNEWPYSFQRNKNVSPTGFWTGCLLCLLLTMASVKNRRTLAKDPTRYKTTLLCREQTEEWKGWMQWVFILYHYYRARFVYNEIRVFVSCYVWLTGFGNYCYFSKTKDFSLKRVLLMLVRINWLPLLLCVFVHRGSVISGMELYYVVPLHTCGFLMTYATCYLQQVLADQFEDYYSSRKITTLMGRQEQNSTGAAASSSSRITIKMAADLAGLFLSLLLHVAFFEGGVCDLALFWSRELSWRFQADKYSAWQGIFCAIFLESVTNLILQWGDPEVVGTATEDELLVSGPRAIGSSSEIIIGNTDHHAPTSATEVHLDDKNYPGTTASKAAELPQEDLEMSAATNNWATTSLVTTPPGTSATASASHEKRREGERPGAGLKIRGRAAACQRLRVAAFRCSLAAVGVQLILIWYFLYGYNANKFEYNKRHPYILILALLGYLLVRNCSRPFCDRFSAFLDFLGRNTLETYVLQFHVLMCQNVQHVLVVFPQADVTSENYDPLAQLGNTVLVATVFVFLASEARKATVVTQESFGKLIDHLLGDQAGGRKAAG